MLETRFAPDSLLEGDGFEPSVPSEATAFLRPSWNPATTNLSGNPEPDFDDRQGKLPSASQALTFTPARRLVAASGRCHKLTVPVCRPPHQGQIE
jgi:hypothetical protein